MNQPVSPFNWTSCKLDELGFLGRGRSRHRPRNDSSLYGGIYPFFQTGDIKQATLYLHDYSQTYNEVGLAQSKLWDPGTLCITIAANIADTAILAVKGCFPDSVVGFISDDSKSDIRFIKYYIDTLKLRMQNISRGTTQDNLSLDKLLSFRFIVPKVAIQRKIAAILSAYDDLIENNLRRIKILEEMARMIYNEYFVKFRFPGHEKVKMVNSKIGKIPEGWKVKAYTDIIEVLSGGTPKTNEPTYWNGDIPFFCPTDAGNLTYIIDTEKAITNVGLEKCNSRLYNKNTVFITARGTVGKVVLCSISMAMNQSCYALVGKNGLPQSYVFSLTSNLTDILKKNTGGATFDTIVVDTFRRLEITVPPLDIITRFATIADSLLNLILNCSLRNKNLRKSRDFLLPRLISGEIDISDLNINTSNLDNNSSNIDNIDNNEKTS